MSKHALLGAGKTAVYAAVLLIAAGAITNAAGSKLEVYELHVTSHIQSRFATTLISSHMANRGNVSQESRFLVRLPKAAFIHEFVMEIDGELYPGTVKEKEQAKKQYERAKKKGQSAGHVALQARNTNVFKVSVNIAAGSKIKFNLTYQELLERKAGQYEHLININPEQVVRTLRVEVYINESRPLSFVKVPPLRDDVQDMWQTNELDNPIAIITQTSDNSAHILYSPTMEEQMEASQDGLNGQLVIQYDVERSVDEGEIQVVDGYFVHFFAPSGLEPVPKNILFVIDVSGSMSGRKIEQTKDALFSILDELREKDKFNIIQFNSGASFWKGSELLDVNEGSISDAKGFVRNMQTYGGTNIEKALSRAIDFLKHKDQRNLETRSSMILFLTDGEPTEGITSGPVILSNLKELNQETQYPIYSLAFGQGADYNLLRSISAKNQGLARKIYEDSDADLQLRGFYKEISTPVLADVNFTYLGDSVDRASVTKTAFPTYHNGTEIIIAGKLKSDIPPRNLLSQIKADTASGSLEFEVDLNLMTRHPRFDVGGITERLWAYITIKRLLDTFKESDSPEEKEQAKEEAKALSLKYNFVTSLTSMVVTKPDETEGEQSDVEDDDEASAASDVPLARSAPSGIAHGPPGPPGHSFVDNDPHFLVKVNGIEHAFCFDVKGAAGEFYQLLYDGSTGVVVNAYIIEEHKKTAKFKDVRTYFGGVALMTKFANLTVTPYKITVNGLVFRWDTNRSVQTDDLEMRILAKKRVNIELSEGIVFSVLRHMTSKRHHWKKDFLGFYILNGAGLSKNVHGLIGQFQHQTASILSPPAADRDGKMVLRVQIEGPSVRRRQVAARQGLRRNMAIDEHVPCWHIRNNGRGLIEGSADHYQVPWWNYKGSSFVYYQVNKKLNS